MTFEPMIKPAGLCAILATLNYCVPQESDELILQVLADSLPKNVIYILSDDHRYDFMGFTGKVLWQRHPTRPPCGGRGVFPQYLCDHGAVFTQSRSILTGLYSHSHTVVDNAARIPVI